MSLAWPAPAKLNLFLHIVGRRPDGYHLLQTVFQLIDLCDEIFVEPATGDRIRRLEGCADIPAEQDLAVRAARLLQQAGGVRRGADIRVLKKIPAGGGLGGGSSDAATVLVALNQLWGLHWDGERLAALGLELGADVPVFVRGHSAWAEGVGERLAPIMLPPSWFLVVCPDCRVSTADIFSDPELTRDTPETTIDSFLLSGGRNDCEPVARKHYPAVAAALDWVSAKSGGRGARLTGTGSCVFAEFGTAAQAQEAMAGLPSSWQGFVARGLEQSPLLARVEESRRGGCTAR